MIMILQLCNCFIREIITLQKYIVSSLFACNMSINNTNNSSNVAVGNNIFGGVAVRQQEIPAHNNQRPQTPTAPPTFKRRTEDRPRHEQRPQYNLNEEEIVDDDTRQIYTREMLASTATGLVQQENNNENQLNPPQVIPTPDDIPRRPIHHPYGNAVYYGPVIAVVMLLLLYKRGKMSQVVENYGPIRESAPLWARAVVDTHLPEAVKSLIPILLGGVPRRSVELIWSTFTTVARVAFSGFDVLFH